MTNDPFTTASKLLTQGYSVIPSGGGAKHKAPLVNWVGYQTTAPDEGQLQKWEDTLKPRLWGIVTNGDTAVLDADTLETRAELEDELGEPHVLTPRGGGHWYLSTAGHPMKTMAGLLPGVDLRGQGGFVNIAGARLAYVDKGVEYPTADYIINKLPIPGDTLIPWQTLPKRILAALNGSKPAKQLKQGKPIPDGQRNATLTRIAGAMRRQGADRGAIEDALLAVECVTPLPEGEIKAIAASVSRYEPEPASGADHDKPAYEVTLKCMADIQPIKVSWLWYPYLPIGKQTLLEGDPGTGKSHVALAIATAVTKGIRGSELLPQGPVLIASAEDGLDDTIRPRLDKMGADNRKIYAIDGLFTLDEAGLNLLEEYIAKILPALVIIDPLVAYLSGDVDIHKANMVRHVTASLARLADQYHTAILSIRHLTKGGSTKAIYRGLGSIDFTASARSVLLAGYDPDDPTRRGFCHIKSNLAKEGEPVGFEITDDGFFWTENCTLTADQIMASDTGGNALQDAVSFLNEELSAGPVDAKAIIEEAKNNGISTITLYRAKKEAGVKSVKCGESGKRGGGKFQWELGGKSDDNNN